MFSERFYRIAFLKSKIANVMGVSSLSFDPKNKVFVNDSSTRMFHKKLIHFLLLIYWLSVALVRVRLLHLRKDLEKMNLGISMIFGATVQIIPTTITVFYSDDLYRGVNGLLVFFRHIHGQYMPHVDPSKFKLNRILEALLLLIGLGMSAHNLGLLLILFFDHSGLIFGMEYIFPPKYLPVPIKLFWLIVHTFGLSGLCVQNAFVLGVVCTYIFNLTLFSTVELRIGLQPKRYNTLSILREDVGVLQSVFRALQILHGNIFCFLGPYILVMHGGFMIASTFFTFVLIRYDDKLSSLYKAPIIIGLVIVLAIWSSVIEISRVLFSRGTKVLGSWGGNKWASGLDNKMMKKFRKSCKPLVIGCGTQFVIRKGTIFLFYKGVMRGTMRALLATK